MSLMKKTSLTMLSVIVASVLSVSTSVAATPTKDQVLLTKSEIQKGKDRQAQINNEYLSLVKDKSSTTGVTSNTTISPNYIPGGPPYSSSVSHGTMTEPVSGDDCGPIAAYNLLYGQIGTRTPSITTLKTDLNWKSGTGTTLSSAWSTTLNNYDTNSYNYTVISAPTPSDVFNDTAVTVGSDVKGNVENIVGYLPGYNSVWYLSKPTYHYVSSYGYSGFGSGSTSSETVTWYDESDINSGGHIMTYSIATLQSLDAAYKSDEKLGLWFQGIIT